LLDLLRFRSSHRRPPQWFANFEIGALVIAALIWVVAAGDGWPQTPAAPSLAPSPRQAAPQQETPPPAAQPPASENPGLLNEMGKALEKSLSVLPTLKSPGETIDDLNAKAKDAAKDAGESLSRLNPSSLVTGRIKCQASANGAPDCKAAADKLCQSKGFKDGKSLATDSVEACSAKVLIPGRTRKPDDCHNDNFVTRALCQ
jgi:hypothetical protein